MDKPAWKAGDTCTIKPSRGHVVPKIRCSQLWTIDSLDGAEACVHNGAPGMTDLPRVPGLTCAARVPLIYLLPPGDAHPTIAAEMGAEVLRLRARITELEATLANERGEGEPPVEGWEWRPDWQDWRRDRVYVRRDIRRGWGWGDHVYPTARDAMREASGVPDAVSL